jgi:hypothetical protein
LTRHCVAKSNVARRSLKIGNDKLTKKEINLDPRLKDPELVAESSEELEYLAKFYEDKQISKVLVSPMRRTIQTCFLALRGHPNFENIQFILCPLLLPTLKSIMNQPSSSIPQLLKELRETYPNANIEALDVSNFAFESLKWSEIVPPNTDDEEMQFIEQLFEHENNYFMKILPKETKERILQQVLVKFREEPDFLKLYDNIQVFQYLNEHFYREFAETPEDVETR